MGTDPSWSNIAVCEDPTPTHNLGLVAPGNISYLKVNATCYLGQSNCTETINYQNDTRYLFDNLRNCELTLSSIATSLEGYLIHDTLAYLWLSWDSFGSYYIGYISPAIQYLSFLPFEYSPKRQLISEPEKLGTIMVPIYEVARIIWKIVY